MGTKRTKNQQRKKRKIKNHYANQEKNDRKYWRRENKKWKEQLKLK